MSVLVGNHNVGFPTRRLKIFLDLISRYIYLQGEHCDLVVEYKIPDQKVMGLNSTGTEFCPGARLFYFPYFRLIPMKWWICLNGTDHC